jgi:hypothetical protein
MATVAIGAAISGFSAAAAVGVGGTFLGFSALQVGLAAAVLGGAAAYASEQGKPDGAQQIAQTGQVSDKGTPQAAEQLDAAALGDEESEKRKRKSAKEKFKIEKEEAAVATSAESGVALQEGGTTKVTGVQI